MIWHHLPLVKSLWIFELFLKIAIKKNFMAVQYLYSSFFNKHLVLIFFCLNNYMDLLYLTPLHCTLPRSTLLMVLQIKICYIGSWTYYEVWSQLFLKIKVIILFPVLLWLFIYSIVLIFYFPKENKSIPE